MNETDTSLLSAIAAQHNAHYDSREGQYLRYDTITGDIEAYLAMVPASSGNGPADDRTNTSVYSSPRQRASITADSWLYTEITWSGMSGGALGLFRAQLPQTLPHLFIGARMDKTINSMRAIHSSQVRLLEGNFNDSFSVFSPDGYELDTLVVLTPDVMSVMLDNVQVNIEIYKDALYMYCPMNRVHDARSFIEHGIRLQQEVTKNSIRYKDERADSAMGQRVAPAGKHLRVSSLKYAVLMCGVALLAAGMTVVVAVDQNKDMASKLEFGFVAVLAVGIFGTLGAIGISDHFTGNNKRK